MIETFPTHVLIIEDSPEDRQAYRRLLHTDSDHRYAYLESETGADGLALLRRDVKHVVDCILLDYHLPDMDGLELLGEIAGDPTTPPIIFLTGHGSESIAVQAMKSGASDYLAKSVLTKELLSRAIHFAIEKKKADRAHHESERLQGALEMAGAVCHEFNQPLQALLGYAELLLIKLPKDTPGYERIVSIREEVDRMGRLNHKLMGITRYETKDYVVGEKIIDLEKAAPGEKGPTLRRSVGSRTD